MIERSVEAFLTGTWSIRTTGPGGQVLRGRATVQGQDTLTIRHAKATASTTVHTATRA
ncbi:hypothetical protein [Streptomyces sp. NPDC054854]